MTDMMDPARAATTRPERFELCPDATLAAVDLVLTDVDGTLTEPDGRLASSTLAALEDLAAAGISVVPVTGRSAGWADAMARQWPVAGVIAESGGVWLAPTDGGRGLRTEYLQDDAERALNSGLLRALWLDVAAAFPGLRQAEDQPYRRVDLAIDHAEAIDPLPRERVEEIAAFCRARGAAAQISSIHVNVWLGAIDKAAGARHFLTHHLRRDRLTGVSQETDLLAAPDILALGDAPNDAPLFAAVPLSVGVANCADHGTRLVPPPAWITTRAHGAGFREVAARLVAARSAAG
jgi:hypothetical protein